MAAEIAFFAENLLENKMIPDIEFATEAFCRFNREIFESSLPEPRFLLSRARTFCGKLSWRHKGFTRRPCDFEMRLSILFDLPAGEWEDIVIHEMIHLYIACGGKRDSSAHGPLFRRVMEEINRRHGRRITVSTRNAGKSPDMRVKAHWVCIISFRDGRLGVAPVAKTRFAELYEAFGGWPEVSSVSWIGTADPWFNRFPKVMGLKAYITDPCELRGHLKGAVRLVMEGGRAKAITLRVNPDGLLPQGL